MNKNKRSRVYMLAGLAGIILLFCGCGESPIVSEAIPRVKVMTVGKQATGQSRRISGSLQAAKESALSFGVSGKILELLLQEGDSVAEGQVVAKLDVQPLKILLENARAKQTSSRAALEEANQFFKRTRTLYQQRGASKQELDAATTKLATAQSSLKTAQGEMDQAEINLAKTTLIAPFSGRIGSKSVEPFQEVSAGQTVITLQGDDSMEIQVRVPETLIRHVDYGQVVQATFPSLPKLSVPGVVTKISAAAKDGNAFPVTVTLSGSHADLRAGMTASVTFNFDRYLEGRTAYLIPLSALAVDAAVLNAEQYQPEESSGRRTVPVFILDTQSGTVQERKVVVGELRDNDIEVYEGLEAGDLVVTAGAAFLTDGMRAEKWHPETESIR